MTFICSKLTGILVVVFLILIAPSEQVQAAPADLQASIAALKNNPQYRGKILSTNIRNKRGKAIFEVRILRKNDRIVIVYIDPKTGQIIGDTLRGK